jgi:chromosome segregation ATPase
MPAFIWDFLKKHWQAIVLAGAIVAGVSWLRHQQAGFAQAITDLNASHQAEIQKINEARAQEEREHAAQLKELQASIAKIQEDYAAAQEALKRQQADAAKQIVKKYGNDADGLAGLLADRLGFVVVKPPSQ